MLYGLQNEVRDQQAPKKKKEKKKKQNQQKCSSNDLGVFGANF